MKMTNNSWSIMMSSIVLIVALLLPVQVCTYNIFMMPLPAESHVFSMAAMTEGLADRGHQVTFFVGENFRLNVRELRNRTEISVVRYRDMIDGEHVNYDAMLEKVRKTAIESGGGAKQMASIISEMYVSLDAIWGFSTA